MVVAIYKAMVEFMAEQNDAIKFKPSLYSYHKSERTI